MEKKAMNDDVRNELVRFWNAFYRFLGDKADLRTVQVESKTLQYKEAVFNILNESKANLPLSDSELRNIQMKR